MNGTSWKIDQIVYLVKHYATMETKEISRQLSSIGVPRTVSAIHSKARHLELSKRDHRGQFTKIRGKILAQLRERPAPLRARVIEVLARDQEGSLRYLAKETGGTLSACWKVCQLLIEQGNAHVTRWDEVRGGWAAVIRIGVGRSVKKPTVEVLAQHRAVQPVPTPKLGPWGLSWGSPTPAMPAERNSL